MPIELKSERNNFMITLFIVYMFIFICRPLEEYQILIKLRLELVFFISIFTYIILKKPKHADPIKYFGITYILGFLAVIVMSYFAANDTAGWFEVVDRYYKIVIFYLLLVTYVNSEEDFYKIIQAYIFMMLFYEVLCLKEYFIYGRHEYRMGIKRLIGIGTSFSDPNAVASSINYSFPFAYALFINRGNLNLSKLKKNMLLLFFVLSPLCIILTGSRAGAVCFAIAVLLILIRAKNKVKLLVILLIVISAGWSMVPQDKIDRIQTLFDEEAGPANAKESADSRKRGFTDGVQFLRENPLLGVGAGNFIDARYRKGSVDAGLQAHNLYGQVMGELGLLGTIVFSMLVLSIISMNFNVILNHCPVLSDFSWAVISSIIILLISGYGSHNLYRFNWLWLSAFSCILLRLSTRINEVE